MDHGQQLSRRGFIGFSVAAASCAMGRAARALHAGANDCIGMGVIGAGRQGTRLLADLARCAERGRDIRVVAVCDICESQLRATTIVRSAIHREWQELVARDDVDAVVIATPDHLHATMAVEAMRAGKHVYCETPMALTLDEARLFRDVASETGRAVQLGARRVSSPRWIAARHVIESGAIGRPVWSQSTRHVNPSSLAISGSPDSSRWRGSWESSLGPAAQAHFDDIAALIAVTGCALPRRVSAAGGCLVDDGRQTPDVLMTTCEYPDGHKIVLSSAVTDRPAPPTVIRGTQGSIHFDRDVLRVVKRSGRESILDVPHGDEIEHMLNWLDCARDGKVCVCGADSGYRAMVATAMATTAYRTRTTQYRGTDKAVGEKHVSLA